MLKINYLSAFLLFIASITFLPCNPDSDSDKKTTNPDEEIAEYIKKNNIPAIKDASGLYYQIIKPGLGTFAYPENTQITIKYEGKLLNGDVFDDGGGQEQTFPLAALIKGWQLGIPKIQKGGELRLIIPPSLGYGGQPAGAVPPNSVLDFNIILKDTQ